MTKVVLPEVGETFISARGLTQKTPMRTTYQNVDLDIKRGSLTSIVAEDRRGKTELLLTLTGHMRHTSGKLSVAGLELPKNEAAIRRIAGMGFFEEVNEVQPLLSLRAVTSAELNLQDKPSGSKATLEYLEAWGFADRAKVKTETLDKYDRVCFGIALGLVGDPALLVVDDIEGDLTLAQGKEIMDMLRRVAHEHGVTVVVACTDYALGKVADVAIPISDAARGQMAAAGEVVMNA